MVQWLERPRIIFYTYILYKTMCTSGKKEQAFLVKTKYKGNVENQKIEFWNLESSHLWNPESTDVESGIHRHGIRNPQRGIRNPRLSWIRFYGEKHFFFILYHILDFLNVICKVLRCPFPRVVHHLSTTGSPHTYLPISIYTDYWISTLGGLFCL